ncbi:MAG: U3 small nucleolar RNA-associated protein 4 [Candelina mexicana]|nr:MAG: U3 small nucleolar RNA-associated protein 4 [Candelina mexicana]
MDIHRCRFVPYPPAAINALAFSHPSSANAAGKGPSTLRLAIGRANGDIEIWNPLKGAWFQETTLRGGKDRSIEGLVWTQDPDEGRENGFIVPGRLRLFSIGYSTSVTEWDLELGRPVRHSGGNYGEVWCLAAQPPFRAVSDSAMGQQSSNTRDEEPQPQHLAVGCADGAVVLLSTADGDLKFQRALTKPSAKKARVLSIAFKNRNIVVAGCADSTIRVLNVRSGQLLRSLTLGAGPAGGPREILVWTVKCLPNGDIVSGDSTGEVKFWDGMNYSLVQRIQGHRADILDVATSADGQTVISGGADRRSTIYRRMNNGNEKGQGRWSQMAHRRYHSHDVKAMATFETKNMSIVASGGLDTTPIIIPLREFGNEEHRTLSSLPQNPVLQSSPSQRLILSWWNRELNIWRLNNPQMLYASDEKVTPELSHQPTVLVASILIKGEESITSASLSADGRLLAVSTISEVKMFRLRRARSKADESLKVKKVDLPISLSARGAKIVQFSPDSRWLLTVTPESRIALARVLYDTTSEGVEVRPKLVKLRRVDRGSLNSKPGLHGSHGRYDRSVSRAAFSSDSRVLVAGDLSGYLDSWVLEGHEDLTQDDSNEENSVGGISSSSSSDSGDEQDDSDDEEKRPHVVLGQYWIRNPNASLLPKLPSAPSILSFRPSTPGLSAPKINGSTAVHPTRHNPRPHSHDLPSGEDRLFALTCEHHFYEFNVLKGKLSAWSKRNPTSIFPSDFRGLRDQGMGCIWDISEHQERIWLYGSNWLWVFGLSKDLPPPEMSKPIESEITEDKSTKGRKKRKRHLNDEGDRRKHTSGAGSRVADDKLMGLGRKMRKITGPESGNQQWISLAAPQESSSDEDEDGLALSRLRRNIESSGAKVNGINDQSDKNEGLLMNGVHEDSKMVTTESPPWWHTFKYRPILGIVPLGAEGRKAMEEGEDRLNGEAFGGLEVALVERPMWDVDLPPRYHGDQEWVK